MPFADKQATEQAIQRRSATHRQPLLLCGLIALSSIAIYLWTAPLRAERHLRSASLHELEATSRCDPDAPRPAYYLGRRWLQLGNLNAAHTAFERAAHHASDDEPAWLGYAATTAGQTAAQDAADILTGYLKLHPESAQAHLALGQAYRRGMAHAAAYREAILAARLVPGDAEAWKLVGSEAAAQGRLPEAIPALQKAVDLQPRDWHALVGLGEMLMQSRRREEGLARLRAASRIAPEEPQVWRPLIEYGDTDAEREAARKAWTAANTASRRQPHPALAALDRLPGRVDTPLLLRDADTLLAENRLMEAKLAYLAILEHNPQMARAYQGVGLAAIAAGDREDAFYFLQRATDLEERLAPAQYALGNWLLEAGFKREAARRLQLAVTTTPGDAACWHALGQAYSGLDVQNRQSEDAYRHAVDLDPRNVVFLLDLAEMLAVNNRLDEAEERYRRAIDLAPHDADALSRLGGFLLDNRPTAARLDEAARMLDEAVRIDPESDFAWYQLGRLAYLRGDDRQAIRSLQRAITVAPQIAEGWYALARALVRNGDRRHADIAMQRFRRLRALDQERTHTSELLDLHPRQYVLHLKLARLYAMSGENAKAIFEYSAYLGFFPGNTETLKELNDLQRQLKAKGQLPSMALFSAMVATSLRHAHTRKS
jgi:tetratricopeptide (TPR) repeat protein